MTGNTLVKEAVRYYDELYNLSLRLTCSFRKAEKMLQHILKEAAVFYEYHEPVDIRKWLLRISLNLYSRFYTVNNSDKNDFIDSAFENIPGYIDKINLQETFKHLSEKEALGLFAEIPSKLRVVLVLKEVLNMNYEEIAELTDIPAGTVAVRLGRARKFIYIKLTGKTSDA